MRGETLRTKRSFSGSSSLHVASTTCTRNGSFIATSSPSKSIYNYFILFRFINYSKEINLNMKEYPHDGRIGGKDR